MLLRETVDTIWSGPKKRPISGIALELLFHEEGRSGKNHSQVQYPGCSPSTASSLTTSDSVWCLSILYMLMFINIWVLLWKCFAWTRAECYHGREWYRQKYSQALKLLIQKDCFSATFCFTQIATPVPLLYGSPLHQKMFIRRR